MKLFVYNKNADLHCISAKETLIHTMGVSDLKHLQRYTMWEIEFENSANNNDTITTLLNKSYLLSNPNKHHHSVETPPKNTPNYWYIEVKSQAKGEDIETKNALNKSFNAKIKTLTQSIVWEIELTSPDHNTEHFISTKLALTTNKENGLLVNPLYETARIVKANDL
ncbi:MAG: hypothetical protein O3A01_00175 [bacterium]|nr:hypothetical protein [bacterium]